MAGPYTVLAQTSPVNYKLLLPQELGSMHNVFHSSVLKLWKDDGRQPVARPGPVIIEGQTECNKGTASIARVLGAQPKLIPPCEIPKVYSLNWTQLQRSWSKIEDSQEKVTERQHAQIFIATE